MEKNAQTLALMRDKPDDCAFSLIRSPQSAAHTAPQA